MAVATPICAVALANSRSDFDNVRPPAQKIDRQAGPDTNRHDRKHSRPFQLIAEIFRKLADQHRDDIARRVNARDQRSHLRLQLRDFALGQRNVELVGDAAAVALLHEVDIFARHLDILAQHGKLHLQRAQIEIGPHDVGNERNQHDIAGGNRRVHVVLCRFDAAPKLAENIELPGCIEADEVDDLRDASSVLGGDESLRSAAAREIGSGSPAAAGARLGRGQRRTDHNGFLRARLLHTVQGDFERRAGRNGPLDQRVELAVVQRPPPLCCFQGVIGVAIAERTDRRRRRELRGQRRLGRMIIRTDRTGGQRRANERAENSGATSRNIAAGAATAATPKLCRPQHRRVHSNSPKAARLHATASAIIHRRRRMHSPPADDVPLADEDGRFRMGVQATVSRSSPEKRMERLYGHSGKYCVDRSLEDREQPSVRR